MHEGKQRLTDANFMLWASSPHLQTDFDFLKRFLTTDCTHVDFLPNFLSGGWIPSFYKTEQSTAKRPFSTLFKIDEKISHDALCDALYRNYAIPSFFVKPIMARVDPKILRCATTTVRFNVLLFLEDIVDAPSPVKRHFGLLTAKTNRDYAIASDLAPFVIRFLTTDPAYSVMAADIPTCSLFARFVITRLLLVYDPEFRGRVTWRSFQSHDYLSALRDAANLDHFKIVYELFVKYDTEKANGIALKDFLKYDESRIHPTVMQRIWRFLPGDKTEGRVGFGDFVYFISLLEDKSTVAGLNFWFRVCDLDDDGVLSLGEMNTLYKYQKAKLRSANLTAIKFRDILPQAMDMIGGRSGVVTRSVLKESGDWPLFFNFLVDTKRFADWEFKDPMYSVKQEDTRESPWDRFCREYMRSSARLFL